MLGFRISFFCFLFFSFLFFFNKIFAQTYAESAVQLSRLSINGSARYQGIGGAQTALGGDIGSITGNPAGLGFFQKSEFSVTSGLNIAQTNTTYFLKEYKAEKITPILQNFAMVFCFDNDEPTKKFKNGSLAISFSRVNNFNQLFNYQGINKRTSKTDSYVAQANGIRTGDLENLDLSQYEYQRAMYFSFLVNPVLVLSGGGTFPDNKEYFTFARRENDQLYGNIDQREEVVSKGGENQWNISYGGNFSDKFYFGAGVAVNTLRYSRRKEYKEAVLADTCDLVRFTEVETLTTAGTGFSMNAGMIYRPFNFLRVGASIHSPTWYSVKDNFRNDFNTTVKNTQGTPRVYQEFTLPGEFEYRLTTPWRATGGVAFFVGKYGFLSADVEYLGNSAINLGNNDTKVFEKDNQFLRTYLRNTLNYKAGAELRWDIFRLRAGYNFQDNPYQKLDNLDRSITTYTAGMGMRLTNWYWDMAVSQANTQSIYQPYSLVGTPYDGLEPIAQQKHQIWQGVISLGFYFE